MSDQKLFEKFVRAAESSIAQAKTLQWTGLTQKYPESSLSMATRLLDSDASESEDGGVEIENNTDFKVNEVFARKFTHNKKREELRRC